MVESTISLPAKWEQFLKRLAVDHQTDLNSVMSELCSWAFSNSEIKRQFELWLDNAFPPKGEAEDQASSVNEETSEDEEENEEESEEESHEHRD